MKYWLLMVFLLISSKCSFAEEKALQAGVETHVEIKRAQEIASDKLKTKISTAMFPPGDPDFQNNLQVLFHKTKCLPDRQVSIFGNGGYSVGLFGSYQSFYYSADGSLFAIEERNKPVEIFFTQGPSAYPVRTANYVYPSGRLYQTRVAIARGHEFNFSPSGQLTGYCIGSICYNALGKITGTRNDVTPCPFNSKKEGKALNP